MDDLQLRLEVRSSLTPAEVEEVARDVRRAFGQPVARKTDPDTSHLAAEDAKRNANTLRARCLAALKAAGDRGLDDFALAEIVHSQQTSAGKRRGELVAAGLVEATDERRLSPSGSKVIVWRYKRR